MSEDIRKLIISNDVAGIRRALSQDARLANEGISCFDGSLAKAHPLHRIADGVMNDIYSDEAAIEMAKVFLEYGADINGGVMVENRDTPLVAAASLHAELLGIFYISRGADIRHAGCHGGTPLHWAAWVGRDKLVKRLIEEGADIEKRCVDFYSTPLLWSVHGYKFGGGENRHNQVECLRLLLAAGADKTRGNNEGTLPIEFLDAEDKEMLSLLQ